MAALERTRVALDVPDLVDWVLATGCRIGEALGLRYGPNVDGEPLLDLDANTWEIDATVVRVPKQGLSCSRARRPPPLPRRGGPGLRGVDGAGAISR